MHRNRTSVALGQQLPAMEVRRRGRTGTQRPHRRCGSGNGDEQIRPASPRHHRRRARKTEHAFGCRKRHTGQGVQAAGHRHSRQPALPAGGRARTRHLHGGMVRRKQGKTTSRSGQKAPDTAADNARLFRYPGTAESPQAVRRDIRPQPILARPNVRPTAVPPNG